MSKLPQVDVLVWLCPTRPALHGIKAVARILMRYFSRIT